MHNAKLDTMLLTPYFRLLSVSHKNTMLLLKTHTMPIVQNNYDA